MSDKVAMLIARMEAHDAEGVAIREEADALGLDAKKIKAIRKAKAEAECAKKTFEALLAADLVPEGVDRNLGGAA